MSRELVRIDTDLDVEFDPDAFILGEPDREAAARLFEELEFTALANEYEAAPVAPRRAYETIFEEKELRALAARIRKAGYVSLDTETTDIFPDPGPPCRHVVRPRAGRSVLSPPAPRLPGRAGPDPGREGSRHPAGRARGPEDPQDRPEYQVRRHRPGARGRRPRRASTSTR